MRRDVSESEFIEAFQELRPENFSHAGLKALYSHLIRWEEHSGIETDLDVIGLCCEYTEDHIDNVLSDFGYESYDELEENTIVIDVEEHDGPMVIYASH